MSKICAQCSKTVYPLEELKCLEKIWHKTCFKCTECGMTLSMKNYKGYDKKPYCNAHYPQTKATVVADTPEMARVTQNTKIQSQIKYHEDFEKMKGTKIEVADNPELRRVKRIGSLVSQVEYKGLNKASDARRPSLPQGSDESESGSQEVYKDSPYSDRSKSHSTVYSSVGSKVEKAPPVRRIGSIADYDPMNENYGSLTLGYHPTSRTNSMSQEWEETVPLSPSAATAAGNFTPVAEEETKEVVRDNDDEVLEAAKDNGPPAVDQSAESQLHNEPDNDGPSDESNNVANDEQHAVLQQFQMNRPVEDAAPSNDSSVLRENGNSESNVHEENDISTHDQGEETAEGDQETAVEASEKTGNTAAVYRAVYSYEAQDEDEVGFNEGDLIVDTEAIAEGWMMGTVEKTGQRGMLPSNYVEPAEV